MTPRPEATPRIDALVIRLAAMLALMASALILLCAFAITRLSVASGPDGLLAYAIPGTAHAVDPAAVPVLATIGLVAAALGVLTLALSRIPQSVARVALTGSRAPPKQRWIRRQHLVLLLGLLALAAVLWLKG